MASVDKNTDQADQRALKTYAAPKLEIFGEVSALTASGSQAGMETGSFPTGTMN
ncbi:MULTISPECIES: hypothetical protein [unclassified Mameliella]|uniref:hypothetical protein n=1 Tax=unclassified Mameliella TaxID=2630630 RepID=UPI00273F03D5|nr:MULTISPECIES: hypothetical protein [unclassified Mameliella]